MAEINKEPMFYFLPCIGLVEIWRAGKWICFNVNCLDVSVNFHWLGFLLFEVESKIALVSFKFPKLDLLHRE